MFSEIGDIKSAVGRFRNDTAWLSLRSRWNTDYNLYRLLPYDAGSGYISYTTNAPRVFADKVVALLVSSNLVIRVPSDVMGILTDDDRRKASNIERFNYGVLSINDDRLIRIPNMPMLKTQMAWYAAIRGAFAIRDYVYKNEKGKTIPRFDCWDIYNVAYGEGEDGLLWAAHTRKITASQAKSEFGMDITTFATDRLIDVVDYWDKEKYGVIVGDTWGIDLTPHNLDYCPVAIIRCGAQPPVWQDNYQYTAVHQGESIFAPIRGIAPILSKTLSDHLTVVRRGVKPPLAHYTIDNREILDVDIYQVNKGANVPMRIGERIEPILPPSMPTDTESLYQIIGGEWQRGSFPHSTYGEVGIRLSGFAINQLQGSIETVLQPCLEAMSRAYKIGCTWLAQQYSKGSFRPLEIWGRTSRGEYFGMPKRQALKPKEVEGDWMLEFQLEPTLPEDDAQKFYIANLAAQGEFPLLSAQSRREMVGVKDPDLEERKIVLELASQLPIPRLYEAFLAALDDNRPDKAKNILAELQRLLGQLGAQGGAQGGGQGGVSGLGTMAAGMPGAGAPAGETGLPTEVYPGEMAGGLPPGAKNAKTAPIGEL